MHRMPRGHPHGTQWCELEISSANLKLLVEEAGKNPKSPCAKGTLAEVARQAGISHQILGHLTSGYRKSCSPATADGIAYALGKPRDHLFSLHVSRLAGRSVKPRPAKKSGVAA